MSSSDVPRPGDDETMLAEGFGKHFRFAEQTTSGCQPVETMGWRNERGEYREGSDQERGA